MTNLYLPARVSREQAREAERDRAEIGAAVSTLKGTLEYWNRELRQIDHRLEMAWFDEGTEHIAGVVPCRYHLIRRNEPPTPPSIDPILGPGGSFREPDSSIFEQLRRGDMWNTAANHERKQAEKLAVAAADRERARATEDRQAEILERVQAATRAFVSMDRSTPWTQTARARRAK